MIKKETKWITCKSKDLLLCPIENIHLYAFLRVFSKPLKGFNTVRILLPSSITQKDGNKQTPSTGVGLFPMAMVLATLEILSPRKGAGRHPIYPLKNYFSEAGVIVQ